MRLAAISEQMNIFHIETESPSARSLHNNNVQSPVNLRVSVSELVITLAREIAQALARVFDIIK